jgi:hypothetical protein
MEESKHKGEPERDYIDEEFENIGLYNKDGTKRYRRQVDTTEDPEGSGKEPLLVEDPPGIGLGFILGM